MPAALPIRRASIAAPTAAAVADAVLFAATLAVLAGCVWGRVRGGGVAILIALTVVGRLAGWNDRAAAVRRLAVLALTLAAYTLLRSHGTDALAYRAGRMSLAGGLTLAAVLAVPAAAVARLRRIADTIAADPGGRTAWLAAAVGVAGPAATLFALADPRVCAGDTMPVVPTAVRLLTVGSRDLAPFVEAAPGRWATTYGPGRPYFVQDVPGRPGIYSAYPAGMELFAWPAVLAAAAIGCDLADDTVHLWVEKLTAAGVAGGGLGLFFLVAVRVGSPAAAFATAWLLATGSAFTTTVGLLLWQQGGVVFWSLVVLLIEFSAGGRVGVRGRIGQGIACGLMLACRPSAATFVGPFAAWAIVRNVRSGVLVAVTVAVTSLPWAVTYQSVYGTPFGPTARQVAADWSPVAYLGGVLASPARGLLVYQPWLVLLAGWAVRPLPPTPLPKRRGGAEADCRPSGPPPRSGEGPGEGFFPPPGWTAFAAFAVAGHLALVASWPEWWGGACYGARLLAEVVPLAGLFAVRPVGRLFAARGGWAAVAAVGLAGAAIHAPCLFAEAWAWNAVPTPVDRDPARLWDWADAPFLRG